MGSVLIGRENVDFFVIPEPEDDPLPFELSRQSDDVVASASGIVVFKTRERHPVHRTVHQIGAPMRAFDSLTSAAFDKAVAMAYSIVNRPESGSEETAESAPPPPLRPLPVNTGRQDALDLEEQSVPQETKPFASPSATTAEIFKSQTDRSRG